jgi:SAM-dependent methyltransferase
LAREAHNRLITDIVEAEIRRAGARYLNGRLIDIGCGSKPYRQLLAPFVDDHIGLDHTDSPHGLGAGDLVGTAYAIPAPSGSFDCALSTAVLEHLEEPADAIRECHRVLRSGAHAVFTAPLIWHIHEEPRDFYRYTEYGLRYLFEKAGFEVVEVIPLSGFWVTGGQMLAYYVNRLNRSWMRKLHVVDALTALIQSSAATLERFDRAERWTWMYLVVARKR